MALQLRFFAINGKAGISRVMYLWKCYLWQSTAPAATLDLRSGHTHFAKQSVSLMGSSEVRWYFILPTEEMCTLDDHLSNCELMQV
ncbi:hypothetical protein RIN58_07125 [Siccibacter colletis]|uniref:hypothetical protein n=1 Tax=Siccibacter colletis TaxID=1505757 RepID=UPI0028BDC138|nr:hypothetical protein [Siccibacter colletis]WNN49865.1 hypothetical protein RIN58_07125 [Siccibacter colletis]